MDNKIKTFLKILVACIEPFILNALLLCFIIAYIASIPRAMHKFTGPLYYKCTQHIFDKNRKINLISTTNNKHFSSRRGGGVNSG